jgi:hypothetical protein
VLPLPYWITVLVTVFAVVVCVTLHYEGLRLLSDKLPMPKHHHRRRIILLIICLLLLHSLEIWVFGLCYFGLENFTGFGEFLGITHMGLLDCIYYSASVFTTLGFGDIVPTGPIRFMTGVEAVAGLTFITWSASYTFLEMHKTWDDGQK